VPRFRPDRPAPRPRGNAQVPRVATGFRWTPRRVAFALSAGCRRDARSNEHAPGEKRHVRDSRSTHEADRQPDQDLTAAIIGDALEFFDYFLIGFVLAFLIGPWKLTFGQSAIVLLSSGVGAIIGA